MTVLVGSLVQSPIGSVQTPAISTNLRSFGVDYWPPHVAAVGGAPAGVVASALPVEANGRAIAGSVMRSYLLDYYDRIHLDPTSIDLGNLVTSQTRTVTVWNAWRSRAISMTALQEVAADGITATGEGALPLAFAPLQMRSWTLAVTTDGPPVIDALLTWVFAGDPSVSLAITGNRLTAWMIAPDWSSPLVETLEWTTDVQQAADGGQIRVVCREAPRRQWEFDTLAGGRERQLVEAALYDWRARTWALPIWPDQTVLAAPLAAGAISIALDTTNLDFVAGGLVMLYQDAFTFELVEVDQVQAAALVLARATVNAWPIGTRIYPCRTARLTDTPQLRRLSSTVARTTVRFEATEPCDWPAVAPAATYLGIPVLEDRSDESADPVARFDRQLNVQDNDIGLVNVVDLNGLAWPIQSHAWWLAGRAARGAHRSLLYWLQGRANAVWLPSWADDLTLAEVAGGTATTLRVEACGVGLYLRQRGGRRHIRIELNSGAVIYRAVTDAADLGDGTEQLALDSALGQQVAPTDVRQISWMMLATLAGDSVEIQHIADSVGLATCGTQFAGIVAEEPA